jgi:hypothetical protein
MRQPFLFGVRKHRQRHGTVDSRHAQDQARQSQRHLPRNM